PRPRGRERRGVTARAEPVLGRGARALRAGRDGAVDTAAAACRADLAAGDGAERAGAAPRPGGSRVVRAWRGELPGPHERLGAEAGAGARRLRPADPTDAPAG